MYHLSTLSGIKMSFKAKVDVAFWCVDGFSLKFLCGFKLPENHKKCLKMSFMKLKNSQK